MKPKFFAFPLAIILASSANAGQFIWTGASNGTWTDSTTVPLNWDITSSVPVSADTYPNYGSTYASDFLNIRNNGDLTAVVPGTTPGADAVYNPGAGVTTTFGAATTGGRGLVIGTGNGPLSTPANVKGYASLAITSGTITVVRNTNGGSEPYMANRADANLLINGGNLNMSAHLNNFRLIQEGFSGITSTITIDSGSLSCRSLDLVYDEEVDPATVFGNGTINVNGGTFTLLRVIRSAASDPGQTAFNLNLNGGTLRLAATVTSGPIFLDANIADLTTVVKAGGAFIDTNTFNATITEVLEHDTSGPAIDGGLTKNGRGFLTLNGTNTFNGGITVNAGTAITEGSRIILGTNDNGAGTGAITLANSYAELQLGLGRNIPNELVISDTGNEKTLYFVNAGSAAISGPVTINETNIDHFRVRSDDSCFLTLSGIVSGPGGIFKYQPGRLNLTNSSNSFTGDVKITHGEVSFTNGALGTAGRIRMEGSGTVGSVSLRWDPTNNQDVSSRIDMFAGKNAQFNLAEQFTPSYAVANVTFASAIGNSTTAALTKTGPGVLTLTQPSTYSGGTTVTQGTLEFPNDGLGTSGSVTMNNGILRWATGNTQDLSSRIVMVSGRTASFSTNGNDVTFASTIGSSTTANLTKTNTLGTLTLNGANTYSGTTTVGGGTLKIGNTTSLGVFGTQRTTAIGTTISGGATLDLNGTTDINEVITLSGTGVGDNGALVNNSGSPASVSNHIAGLTVAATGSGSGYSTAPTVDISGTGTGATATASLGVTTESFVVNVSGNRDYTVAPNVTIAGGGTGATATAILSDGTFGTVIGITVTSAGSGFTTAPTATISGGTSTGTTTTTFTGNASNFTVGGLTLTNAGTGYTSAPSVTFDGSPATVATTFSSVILAANSSIGGTGNTTIDGVVSESGGARALTKVGAGTVTLNGLNTYTGETKVDAGTLSISTDDTLANAAAVRIDSSAFLNLGFTGTDTVDRLYLGGVEQVSGTWGSLASSATNKTARITGSGILDVTNGAAASSPYTIWSGGAAFNVDSNNDGVDNGLAWFLGALNKDVNATGLLPKTTQTAGALVLEFDCLNAAARGPATFAVQYSNDLGQSDPWAETAVPGAEGSFTAGVVDFLVTDPLPIGEGLLKVVATIPAGEAAAGKLFGRVSGQP